MRTRSGQVLLPVLQTWGCGPRSWHSSNVPGPAAPRLYSLYKSSKTCWYPASCEYDVLAKGPQTWISALIHKTHYLSCWKSISEPVVYVITSIGSLRNINRPSGNETVISRAGPISAIKQLAQGNAKIDQDSPRPWRVQHVQPVQIIENLLIDMSL